VVSFETLEHLAQPASFLAECRRVLKDDGLFLCSTPNKAVTSPYTRRPLNPFHLREFRLEEFHRLLSRFFPYVSLYGQNFIRRDMRWRFNILAGVVKPGLLALPWGQPLVEFLNRRLLGRRYSTLNDRPQDDWDALYRRWPVRPLRDGPLCPVHFVAVASPRPLLRELRG